MGIIYEFLIQQSDAVELEKFMQELKDRNADWFNVRLEAVRNDYNNTVFII